MERLADRTGARQSCDATADAAGDAVGRGRTAAQFQALWPTALLSPDIAPPAEQRARVVSGRSLDGDPAWPAGGSGTGDARRIGSAARTGAGRDQRRADRTGGRGLRPARPLHAGQQRRRMVRPASARAHPSLHGPAPARRDRAGRRARLPALPVRLAARDRRDAPGRAGCGAAAVALLEGFEAPAGAWETEILPARIAGYEPAWLDDQCLAGRIAWARLAPGRGNGRDRVATPVRTTPITLLARRHAQFWTFADRTGGRRAAECARASGARLSARARCVVFR